ncbi:mutagen-sensitive 301 [Lycorma delicatula]|uniref:mutagen-sensitive 301 n=1 Tax=Lycorma delicatula TaxID=130591 RepID=UPI003F514738
MQYFNTEHKTSTPIRAGCKRLSENTETSPILRSNNSKRRNIDYNEIYDSDDIFQELIKESSVNESSKKKFNKVDELENNVNKDKLFSEISNSAKSNCSPSCSSLLSVDDSFLKGFDLSSAAVNTKINCKNNCNIVDCDKSYNNSFLNDNIEDDHAWDMSISAEINHECCDKSKCNNSQEITDSFLSESIKWEGQSVIDSIEMPEKSDKFLNKINDSEKSSFGNKIKTILLNNAQKPMVKLPLGKYSACNSQESTDSLNSDFFGLPPLVKSLIKKYKGIHRLYDWQEECLKLEAVKNRKNLVYALPTSGGKTLIAEILILNEILCREKNVIFVMPYVSIVQEKVRSLSPFAVELGFLIEEYAGAKGQFPPQKRRRKHTVFIATIEKALGLVHSYLESDRMSELGLVVVDELHLIGESRRGASLESMLVKLLFSSTGKEIQIIGMSATMGNIDEIAHFLKADLYTHDFRPVELKEYVKVEDEIFHIKCKEDPPLTFCSRTSFPYSPELKKQDPDEIGGLVREIAPDESCLVFCPSKKNCENVAMLICQILDRNLLKFKMEEKYALYKALKSEGNGNVCNILNKTIPFGVAYHNSGLTTAERNLIEEAFCAKTIFCICCTSTLAAGVNLPAKRVILRSPYIGREFINLSRYKQMVGRAGRAGMTGGVGESFLVCKPTETKKVGELLCAPMDYCKSHLHEKESLSSFVISAVGLCIASSVLGLKSLLKGTLYHLQNSKNSNLISLVDETVSKLIEFNIIKRIKNQSEEEKLVLSNLGKAAMKGGFDVETTAALLSDLQLAKKSLVLLNHLHLLYLITPYSMLDQIKLEQQIFITKFMKLNAAEQHVASVLGIDERCISYMMCGRKMKNDIQEKINRFYLSLILYDLWNERSVWEVSHLYEVTRGLVYTLLNSAVSFAASVTRFCEELEEMWCFRRLLIEITSRLSHCCKPELLPLMELPAVKLGRARQLYNAGFKTVSIIANAEPQSLVKAIDHLPRKVAHQIIAAAKLKIVMTAETLQEEAEEVLAVLQNTPTF